MKIVLFPFNDKFSLPILDKRNFWLDEKFRSKQIFVDGRVFRIYSTRKAFWRNLEELKWTREREREREDGR